MRLAELERMAIKQGPTSEFPFLSKRQIGYNNTQQVLFAKWLTSHHASTRQLLTTVDDPLCARHDFAKDSDGQSDEKGM